MKMALLIFALFLALPSHAQTKQESTADEKFERTIWRLIVTNYSVISSQQILSSMAEWCSDESDNINSNSEPCEFLAKNGLEIEQKTEKGEEITQEIITSIENNPHDKKSIERQLVILKEQKNLLKDTPRPMAYLIKKATEQAE